ncbi:MAG TPA: DUF4872 domain-containing protein [Ardenticatenaceae bacterium]|nr:DUF4872 domain-containing protein [Ardenticatenaceae bacterium]
MSSLFPPQAQQLAEICAAHGLAVSVEQAFLLARPLNFFYLRGPHLVPPHQVAGLSPRLLLDGLRGLGCELVPPAEDTPHAALLPDSASLVGGAMEGASPGATPLGERHALVAIASEPDARPAVSQEDVPARQWYRLVPPEARIVAQQALPPALAQTAYTMMVCSGAWQGVDGIEYWSEDIVRWEQMGSGGDGRWESSAVHIAAVVRESDGLWRSAYATALRRCELGGELAGLWEELAAHWCRLADDLDAAAAGRAAARLSTLSRALLRLAHQESRAWGRLIDAFGAGI